MRESVGFLLYRGQEIGLGRKWERVGVLGLGILGRIWGGIGMVWILEKIGEGRGLVKMTGRF